MQNPAKPEKAMKRQYRNEGFLEFSKMAAIMHTSIQRHLTGSDMIDGGPFKKIWEAVWERDHGECIRCGELGKYFDGNGDLGFYHVVLPGHGGKDEIDNLRVLCQNYAMVVTNESQRVGTGIGQLKRIVPPDVEEEPPQYQASTQHKIGKWLWFLAWVVVPIVVVPLVAHDVTYALPAFFLGIFLLLIRNDQISNFYDRTFTPEKVTVDATYQAWRKRNTAWHQERRRLAHQEPGARSRYIPAEVKRTVWKRDGGRCVECGSKISIHLGVTQLVGDRLD